MNDSDKTKTQLIKELIEIRKRVLDPERSQKRMEHLNLVLRAIRNVNQLITQEKDRDRLLKGACEILTEDRGYSNAWIALLDEEQRATAAFESGLGASFEPMAERLKRGELTRCAKETLEQEGAVITYDPPAECGDCPLVGQYSGRKGVSVRLEHEGVVYGLISVSVPEEFSRDEEELSLFTEAAGDIAFALHNLKMEEEHKRSDTALEESEERYKNLSNLAYEGILIHNKGVAIDANESMAKMFGYQREELIGKNVIKLCIPEEYHGLIAEKISQEVSEPYEVMGKKKDGTLFHIELEARNIRESGGGSRVAAIRDITDRKQAEKEKAALEEQLLQSQKMESIGRLAGGVAHDFNNLLTVILSACSFMADDLREGDPLLKDVREIKNAGDRAVALTRQLLAFSRRQMLQTEVLDLNLTLKNLDKMLRRLIGEDIDIETDLDPDIWKIEADPGQIEQIVMNLAVNARDAMPGIGKLTIETANVELDEEYARNHVNVTPGPYVMLAVSDTGSGMDKETTAQIFDPFFTTKEKGKGTGLGLSMVYGIVKQHGGNIWVYSEPGKGTIFKIYLPKTKATERTPSMAMSTVADSRGTETVLVVEDERAVLKLAVRTLERKGYNVLAARDGLEGQGVANTHEGPIHLLLTDVVMPNMGGKELAQKLLATRPQLKVLYMSGYTDNAIVHHGVLDKDTHFVQKPFGLDSLVQKVREVLDYQKVSSSK